MSLIKITSDKLGPGSVPLYDMGCRWPYPVYVIDTDGDTILRRSSGQYRYLIPEFSIDVATPEQMAKEVTTRLTPLCLAAQFAGRAQVVVRNEMLWSGYKSDEVIHSLEMGLMFTMDWQPDQPGFGYKGTGWGLPDEINDLGDDVQYCSESFRNASIIMEVLNT